MKLRISQQAEADLVQIYLDGVERFGVARAEAYLDRLEEALGIISSHPELARLRPEITPPIRIQPTGNHIVIYLVDEDESVRILRIRHGRENWI